MVTRFIFVCLYLINLHCLRIKICRLPDIYPYFN